MFGQFEDAEDAKHSDERKATGTLGALTVAFRLLDDEYDEVWEDCQHVNDVHCVVTELTLRRTRRETNQELTSEPGNARLLTQPSTAIYLFLMKFVQ